MIKKIEAVIFDLDGTLVDSMWMWKTIDVEYLGRFGHELPDDLQTEIEGMSFSETANYFKERFQLPDSLDQIKADWNTLAWDKYANDVPMKRGAVEFLKLLRNKKIKMGIATSNSRELVSLVTKKHGVDTYFKSIRTSCEVNKGKPAPDIYLKVAEDLGVDPAHCVAFEDVVQGIMAGKNAGMKVVAVADKYSEKDITKKKELADYYIDSYEDLMEMFQTINEEAI